MQLKNNTNAKIVKPDQSRGIISCKSKWRAKT